MVEPKYSSELAQGLDGADEKGKQAATHKHVGHSSTHSPPQMPIPTWDIKLHCGQKDG